MCKGVMIFNPKKSRDEIMSQSWKKMKRPSQIAAIIDQLKQYLLNEFFFYFIHIKISIHNPFTKAYRNNKR
jgi:hypothetical protein